MNESQFAWNESEKQFKPVGWIRPTITGGRTMSEGKNEQVYELTRKNGRVDKVRFTGKRATILDMLKQGKSNDDIVAAGFSKNTVLVVRWQAKTLNILTDSSTEA